MSAKDQAREYGRLKGKGGLAILDLAAFLGESLYTNKTLDIPANDADWKTFCKTYATEFVAGESEASGKVSASSLGKYADSLRLWTRKPVFEKQAAIIKLVKPFCAKVGKKERREKGILEIASAMASRVQKNDADPTKNPAPSFDEKQLRVIVAGKNAGKAAPKAKTKADIARAEFKAALAAIAEAGMSKKIQAHLDAISKALGLTK